MAFVKDKAIYLPQYITEAAIATLGTESNVIAEIKKVHLGGKMMRVRKVAVDANPDVLVRLRENARSMQESNAFTIDHTAQYDLHCTSLFYFSLYNTTAVAIPSFAYRYGYWLEKPTVADKLFYDLALTPEDKSIAKEFDIASMVKTGILPIPLDKLIEREFQITTKRTVSKHENLTTGGLDLGTELPSTDTFLILLGIALEKPPTSAYTTQVNITVDKDPDYHTMRAWAGSGSGYDIPLWIPAVDSFELRLETNTAIAGYDARYTYAEAKLTDWIKMKFGILLPEDDMDLYRRIRAGLIPG